jgi:hypothetical protein
MGADRELGEPASEPSHLGYGGNLLPTVQERLAQKPSWEYEPKLSRPGQRPLKPDMGTPKRNPQLPNKRMYGELKPDSPSGRAAGARALKKYQAVTNDPVRLFFYTLKDFI